MIGSRSMKRTVAKWNHSQLPGSNLKCGVKKTIKAVERSGLQVVSSNWNDAALASARFNNRITCQ